jgi:hypothetical protein
LLTVVFRGCKQAVNLLQFPCPASLYEQLYEQLKEIAPKYHRSFNGELIFAIEQYLTYWYRPANEPSAKGEQ